MSDIGGTNGGTDPDEVPSGSQPDSSPDEDAESGGAPERPDSDLS